MSKRSQLVQKLWNYYNMMRNDELSYEPKVERRLTVVDELAAAVSANLTYHEMNERT